MKKNIDKFFLAANSFSGFVSNFYDNYFPEKGYRVFIIKGGPGTGKSSFMKKIAKAAADKDLSVTVCPCSSDPDSLDAVIIRELKTVIFDGTSPHVVEAKYPGVCENIIDLGKFWDTGKLEQNRYQIISAANINSAFHKTAALYLSACGEIRSDSFQTAKTYTNREKAIKFAQKICDNYIPEKFSRRGFEHIRYIEGITPKGIVTFPGSLYESIGRTIVINDNIGTVSSLICDYIRKAAVSRGYEIITVKNPYLPDIITDHLIIPELDLSIVTENKTVKFPKELPRVYSRRFTDAKQRSAKKTRITFNEKVEKELLASAKEMLAKAKHSHDILEKYYVASMDFDALDAFAKDFTDNLLK